MFLKINLLSYFSIEKNENDLAIDVCNELLIYNPNNKRLLIKNENKIVILSHFGRPDGKITKDLSLRKLLGYLNATLNLDIKFLPSLEIDIWTKEIEAAPFPSIFLLENIRFSKLFQ